MDKYFSPSYDPALDFTLADVTDASTGLIAPGGFDGWDRMVDVVRARREDKKESERRDKALRRAERERVRRDREERRSRGGGGGRRARSESGEQQEEEEVGARYDAKSGLIEMRYSRGAREWDKGKETPT